MQTAARNGRRRARYGLTAGLRAGALAAALWALPGWTCGPDFPHELLSDRRASVYELVEGTFDFEASRLAPKPADVLKPNENPWEAPGESRIELEQRELGEAAYAKVEAMRLSLDDEQAWAAGEGLSEEVRLYTAGARAFHAGDTVIALQRFDAVLALAAEQQRSRGLWARYMSGRVNLAQAAGGAGAGELETTAAATAAAQDFQAVRAAVAAGVADPLGLAVASYGEEAALQRARGNLAAAVRLYAEQAAHGSASGRASLLFVARDLFADEAALRAALADPLLQQLLASYVYTRTGEFEGTDEAGQPKPQTGALQRYYAAIEADAAGSIGSVDRVAAAAYRSARYELAGTLAARSQTALAHWVRAKLALRAGDDKAAADAYAQASRAFPRDEDWGTNPNEGYSVEGLKPACRVDGERAILALGRGDYVEALRLFHAGGGQYWMDEAQVAERVLSLDELKRYVDTNVPEPAAPKANDEGWPQPDAQLRALLGRRLLRSGRYAEAAAYFPPALRDTAAAYAKARLDAPKQGRIERAETLFRAARLARESGMELLALELAPDAALFQGSYELTDPTLDAKDRKLVGADEAQRVAASQPQPVQRFHYRFVAADLANQAADLVPARSQAFAAMLCSATGWLINRDYAQARSYYRRYVDQGPYVAWAANFGNQCPAPDFDGAAKRLQFERVRWVKQIARRYAPFVAGGALVLVVGFVFWRRRRTKPAG
jgi:hypothetical protein